MRDRYASLREGLVGAWIPSVSGSGLLLPDLSGQGNNGALTNMGPEDWVSSQYGRALDFDGSNDLVIFNSVPLGTIHTTAAWVYLRYPAEYNFQGICGDGSSNTCSLAATGNGISITGIAYSWSETAVSATVPNFLNVWTHIAAARINNEVEFFYNGVSYGKVTGSSIPSFNCNRIGQRNGVVDTNGIIDDFRIYNRALSEPEIKLLASRPGIGLRPQRRTMYYAPPTGARRRRILTSMP